MSECRYIGPDSIITRTGIVAGYKYIYSIGVEKHAVVTLIRNESGRIRIAWTHHGIVAAFLSGCGYVVYVRRLELGEPLT